MSEDIQKVAAVLQSTAPLAYQMMVDHIKELESTANNLMVNAVENTLLRQNQGKVQLLQELLKDLNI